MERRVLFYGPFWQLPSSSHSGHTSIAKIVSLHFCDFLHTFHWPIKNCLRFSAPLDWLKKAANKKGAKDSMDGREVKSQPPTTVGKWAKARKGPGQCWQVIGRRTSWPWAKEMVARQNWPRPHPSRAEAGDRMCSSGGARWTALGLAPSTSLVESRGEAH